MQNKLDINTDLWKQLSGSRQQAARDHTSETGNLRAGNSGMLTRNGEFAGACPMEVHLRQLGINLDPVHTDNKLIMFQLGHLNESALIADLKRILPDGYTLKTEEEIPIEWKTENGTKVTGRPDIVVLNNHRPVLGMELKSVASIWVTCNVLFERMPKLANVCQAAHYSWKLDVPYKLIYKQYANQVIPDWKIKQLPSLPPELRHFAEWKGGVRSEETIKQIGPYELVYELQIDKHGQVLFRIEEVEKLWRRSIVNVNDIERFYEFCSKIESTGNLGGKQTPVDLMGKPASYSHCDKYCTGHRLLGEYVHDYSLWRAKAEEFRASLPTKEKEIV